jgi:hypothetical protein
MQCVPIQPNLELKNWPKTTLMFSHFRYRATRFVAFSRRQRIATFADENAALLVIVAVVGREGGGGLEGVGGELVVDVTVGFFRRKDDVQRRETQHALDARDLKLKRLNRRLCGS